MFVPTFARRTRTRFLALLLASAAPIVALPATAKNPNAGLMTNLTPSTPSTASQPGTGVVKPLWGNIDAFWGNIDAFYGNIDAFWGNIDAFYGNIDAFYGNIDAFSGKLDPFWGNIDAFNSGLGANTGLSKVAFSQISGFWGTAAPQWQSFYTTWRGLGAYSSSNSASYAQLAGQLSQMVNSAAQFWGPSVQARTGKSFTDGFVTPTLAKFGINLNDPTTLAALTPGQQVRFTLAWYDGLMEFTGTDHVDHWMREVNWTPSLTQTQGGGSNTVIGLLDFTIKNAPDLQDNVTSSSGVSTYSNGHGAAVASLMVAAHDGSGVMGIAPNASVVVYNPFDSSGSTNWTDVTTGVVNLVQNNASIVNASLGVPGWTLNPGWNTVFTDKNVRKNAGNTLFVIAAGNDGISQTSNVTWDQNNPSFIVVGSVDPNLNISAFSNRPGTACLVGSNGKCTGDYLMNHFIVASGEYMLVSDDHGGFTRASGTSFAAPLVSGAVALLNDRWPWLAQHPDVTSYIILKSAKDLGAPGVDPVYGVGLLDVTASQSPLNFDTLQWLSVSHGLLIPTPAAALKSSAYQSTWEANGTYVYAYEFLPGGTFRDFSIPLSSKLIGQKVLSASGQMDQFQQYLYGRMMTWAKSFAPSLASGLAFDGTRQTLAGFAPIAGGAPVANPWGLAITMGAEARQKEAGTKLGGMGFNTEFSVLPADKSWGLHFGFGNGASALSGQAALGFASDYDPTLGGGNPLLGFASGGAFASWHAALTTGLSVSAGFTQKVVNRDLNDVYRPDQGAALAVGSFRATAQHVGVTWQANEWLALTGGVTRLNEDRSLLGVQSVDRNDLGQGSVTNGTTIGADLQLTDDLMVSIAGTIGKTEATQGTQNLRVGSGGLTSTAFEVAAEQARVFDNEDRARLSVSQPLHLENGNLAYQGVEVVDRATGQLGLVSRLVTLDRQSRPFVAEVLYTRPVMEGIAQLGLFGRGETQGVTNDGRATAAATLGARLSLSY